MIFYGKELIRLGIIMIIAAAVLGTVFLVLHIIMSSKLKRVLEREYGSEKTSGGSK